MTRALLLAVLLCAGADALAQKKAVPARLRGDPSAWPRLDAETLLVTAKDAWQRESAALLLGRRGARTSIPLLAKRLEKDKNPWVRARCAEALGRIGDVAALPILKGALARAKRQRVRRAIAKALMRLGAKEGLLELMWQLSSGTNHSRADAMAALVDLSGRPLGQNVKAWWSYLAARGYQKLAKRARGAPAVASAGEVSVRGLAAAPAGFALLPAVVLRVGKKGDLAVTERDLAHYERRYGKIPDGVLLLVEQGPAAHQEKLAPADAKAWADERARRRKAGLVPRRGPGLTSAALAYLLARAPKLLGVGIDAAKLDAPGSTLVRDALAQKKRIALTGAKDFRGFNAGGTRALLVRRSTSGRWLLLGLLP
ncbi:MAG: HEAT repeat domain-containing protein [Myxococcales bacterium]|nr:HEAT repeat domain-containing protein [Myxococcales bacterium]